MPSRAAEAAALARLHDDAQDNITADFLSDTEILSDQIQERENARQTDSESGITYDEATGNREPVRDLGGEAQREPSQADRGQAQAVAGAGIADQPESENKGQINEPKTREAYADLYGTIVAPRAIQTIRSAVDAIKSEAAFQPGKAFSYPVVLESQPEGGFLVTFPDVPEAITQGDDGARRCSIIKNTFG